MGTTSMVMKKILTHEEYRLFFSSSITVAEQHILAAKIAKAMKKLVGNNLTPKEVIFLFEKQKPNDRLSIGNVTFLNFKVRDLWRV